MKKLFLLLFAFALCHSFVKAQDSLAIKPKTFQRNEIVISGGLSAIGRNKNDNDNIDTEDGLPLAYTISYYYYFSPKLAIGTNASYTYDYHDDWKQRSDTYHKEYRRTYFTLLPVVHWSWWNNTRVSPALHLYSEFGLGVSLYKKKEMEYSNNKVLSCNKLWYGVPSMQLTLLGISIGTKIYVIGELGAGAIGSFIHAGIGYRF